MTSRKHSHQLLSTRRSQDINSLTGQACQNYVVRCSEVILWDSRGCSLSSLIRIHTIHSQGIQILFLKHTLNMSLSCNSVGICYNSQVSFPLRQPSKLCRLLSVEHHFGLALASAPLLTLPIAFFPLPQIKFLFTRIFTLAMLVSLALLGWLPIIH